MVSAHEEHIVFLRSSIGLMSRLSTFIPNRCLTPLIHGLLLSKVRYGLPLFADIRLSDIHGTNGLMKEIQVEINRGLRIVLGVRLADKISIADLSAKVGVPSINQLAAEVTLMEIWKTFQMDLPASSYHLLYGWTTTQSEQHVT